MLRYSLLLVFFLLFAYTSEAQNTTSPDSTRHTATHKGVYSEVYILPGSGQYATQQNNQRFLSADLGLKGGYNFGHFYVNAGLGLYFMKNIGYNVGLFTTTEVTTNKFVVEIPIGAGFFFPGNNYTVQTGVDFPYLTEINMGKGENGFAASPYFSVVWKAKHKKSATGFIIKVTTNLQNSDIVIFNPSFYGAGLIVRY